MGDLAIQSPSPSKVWATLVQLLPSRDADSDYWWYLTGSHLAFMLNAAGYMTEDQYKAPLFHYHWMVSSMGPAYMDGKPAHWSSELAVEGLPIEYSWKWNVGTKRPVVRYTSEAIDVFSGTALDPLNQGPSRKLLHRLENAWSGVDLTTANQFFASLYNPNRAKYVHKTAAAAAADDGAARSSSQNTTSIMIAAE